MSSLWYVVGNSLGHCGTNQASHSGPTRNGVRCYPVTSRSFSIATSPLTSSTLAIDPSEDVVMRTHSVRFPEGSVTQWAFSTSFSRYLATSADRSSADQLSIDMLPDNLLLEIFRFYVGDAGDFERWHTLVHVCQKWRYIVVASGHHLNLRLVCTGRTPTREMIDAWPSLPIIIKDDGDPTWQRQDAANIFAAFEHSDRICEISLPHVTNILWQQLVEMAQESFPRLTSLELAANDETTVIVPDSFLGGSAPRLQNLDLNNVPFPALPNLLLSATDLVYLRLWDVPNSGYISPHAMITCISTMARLETFYLGFRSPRPPPDPASRLPPPFIRAILPALTHLCFQGNSEYLDDLVAQVDVPLLDDLSVTFFNQLVFYTPQLLRLVRHTEKLKAFTEADILFHGDHVKVTFSSLGGMVDREPRESLVLAIKCRDSVWQLSALVQILSPLLPLLPTLERLDIFEGHHPRPHWQHDMERYQWLEVLQPFTAVKNVYLSEELALHVVPALEELVGDGATDVLPALRNLFLEGHQLPGPVREALEKFITERQLSGYPVAVHRWERGYRIASESGGQ